MHRIFMLLLVLSTASAFAKTDVRALVSRPKDVSTRKERKCRADSDCMAFHCREKCKFDGVANKKFVSKIAARCVDETKKNGSAEITVDCASDHMVDVVRCKRGYCAIEENLDPKFGKPKIGTSNEAPAEED